MVESTLTTSQSRQRSFLYPLALKLPLNGITPSLAQGREMLQTLSTHRIKDQSLLTCKFFLHLLSLHKYSLVSSARAKVNDATQSSVTGLNWFKIYHDGLDGSQWAVDKLIANQGKVSFTIPSCIPAGQYLLRVELIGTVHS